jgi:hypothetical protein
MLVGPTQNNNKNAEEGEFKWERFGHVGGDGEVEAVKINK